MKLPEQTEMNYKTRKPKRVETETGYRIGDTEYRTRFSCSDELCEYMSGFSNGKRRRSLRMNWKNTPSMK
ncbi:hypothetical protein AGMMS49992_22300 [Clostridia bacterium]|nr:hypothetical protein AGMMS49992_22300 [Clostridia bacterium]